MLRVGGDELKSDGDGEKKCMARAVSIDHIELLVVRWTSVDGVVLTCRLESRYKHLGRGHSREQRSPSFSSAVVFPRRLVVNSVWKTSGLSRVRGKAVVV